MYVFFTWYLRNIFLCYQFDFRLQLSCKPFVFYVVHTWLHGKKHVNFWFCVMSGDMGGVIWIPRNISAAPCWDRFSPQEQFQNNSAPLLLAMCRHPTDFVPRIFNYVRYRMCIDLQQLHFGKHPSFFVYRFAKIFYVWLCWIVFLFYVLFRYCRNYYAFYIFLHFGWEVK